MDKRRAWSGPCFFNLRFETIESNNDGSYIVKCFFVDTVVKKHVNGWAAPLMHSAWNPKVLGLKASFPDLIADVRVW